MTPSINLSENSYATNKELAYKVGERLIRQQQLIIAMESFISEYCLSDPRPSMIDWRTAVKENQDEEALQKTASAWLRGLQLAIDAETQDSSLIRVLHTELLADNSRNILEME